MMIFAFICWGIGIGILCWYVGNYIKSRKHISADDIEAHKDSPVMAFCRSCGKITSELLPGFAKKRGEKDRQLLEMSGLFPRFDSVDVLGMEVAGMLAGMVVLVLLLTDNILQSILIGIIAGLLLVKWRLKGMKQEYQDELRREFPTAIDMITLGLEGGLDFSAGLKEMVDNSEDGPIRHEFARIINDIKTGMARADALKGFAGRVESLEIKTVITALIQAMELGSGIVETLRIQAEQLRYSRLMNAEEAAQKIPTKMMLPMALFILPCVFIIIFAPIAISLIATFKGFSR